jgi:Domain of unknown function (DUF4126)
MRIPEFSTLAITMETALAVIVGIGLAASCGFRVFVPILVVGIAAQTGHLDLADGFEWIGTPSAIAAFTIATILEVGAYYVPWLDNLLDTVASPAAVVAGVVLFAANAVDFDPLLQWSLAIIAGGGAAAIVQGGSVATRVASTTTTGGLANFAVTTIETMAGFAFSVLSIVVPILALTLLLIVIAGMYYVGRSVLQRLFPSQNKMDG